MSKAPPLDVAREAAPLFDRIDSMTQQTTLIKALIASQPGTKSGNTHKAWKLDTNTLYIAASKRLFPPYQSAPSIHEEMRELMGDVDSRCLSNWLTMIQKKYGEMFERRITELDQFQSVAFQSGDIVAISGLVMGAIAPRVMAFSQEVPFGDLDNKTQHLLMRFVECVSSAAKVQADAKHAEAKTQKVLLDVRKIIGRAAGEVDKDSTDGDALKAAAVAIDQLMGVGGGQ